MKARYLIVATPAELQLVSKEEIQSRKVIITGVGGTNVISALRDIPRDADVLNVGYAGSAKHEIGARVHIGEVRLWHPNVEFDETTYNVDSGQEATCFTSGDFVTEADARLGDAVVDMELAYIAAFGFTKLRAIKVVSDNLNKTQYETNVK